MDKFKYPGWYSRVTECGTKRLIHGLVKQTQICVNFIALCDHKTGAFEHRKAVSFQIGLCQDAQDAHLWSWILGNDCKSTISMQASEARLLRRIHSVIFRNEVRSCEIRKVLNVELFQLRIERSQLRWFGHVTRIPMEILARQFLLVTPKRNRPRCRTRTTWRDNISDLAWPRVGVEPEEFLSEIAENRVVFRFFLRWLPCDPLQRNSGYEIEWKNEWTSQYSDFDEHHFRWFWYLRKNSHRSSNIMHNAIC